MITPEETDYIDIHTHGQATSPGMFMVKCLMAHQPERPHDYPDTACSVGAHPWYLTANNLINSIETVTISATGGNVVAIGETGIDKVKGPAMDIQVKAFEAQAAIASQLFKPVIVHCVKAWDELLSVHGNLKPQTPWLIHGFMGSTEQAKQLIDKGLYISLWYSFALSDRSASVVKNLPIDRLFLETDSADADIKEIYAKVAAIRGIQVEELKRQIVKNYFDFTPSRCKCCSGHK